MALPRQTGAYQKHTDSAGVGGMTTLNWLYQLIYSCVNMPGLVYDDSSSYND